MSSLMRSLTAATCASSSGRRPRYWRSARARAGGRARHTRRTAMPRWLVHRLAHLWPQRRRLVPLLELHQLLLQPCAEKKPRQVAARHTGSDSSCAHREVAHTGLGYLLLPVAARHRRSHGHARTHEGVTVHEEGATMASASGRALELTCGTTTSADCFCAMEHGACDRGECEMGAASFRRSLR